MPGDQEALERVLSKDCYEVQVDVVLVVPVLLQRRAQSSLAVLAKAAQVDDPYMLGPTNWLQIAVNKVSN